MVANEYGGVPDDNSVSKTYDNLPARRRTAWRSMTGEAHLPDSCVVKEGSRFPHKQLSVRWDSSRPFDGF